MALANHAYAEAKIAQHRRTVELGDRLQLDVQARVPDDDDGPHAVPVWVPATV